MAQQSSMISVTDSKYERFKLSYRGHTTVGDDPMLETYYRNANLALLSIDEVGVMGNALGEFVHKVNSQIRQGTSQLESLDGDLKFTQEEARYFAENAFVSMDWWPHLPSAFLVFFICYLVKKGPTNISKIAAGLFVIRSGTTRLHADQAGLVGLATAELLKSLRKGRFL